MARRKRRGSGSLGTIVAIVVGLVVTIGGGVFALSMMSSTSSADGDIEAPETEADKAKGFWSWMDSATPDYSEKDPGYQYLFGTGIKLWKKK